MLCPQRSKNTVSLEIYPPAVFLIAYIYIVVCLLAIIEIIYCNYKSKFLKGLRSCWGEAWTFCGSGNQCEAEQFTDKNPILIELVFQQHKE